MVDGDGSAEEPIVEEESQVVPILEFIAVQKGMNGDKAAAWVEAVWYKLEDILVESLQDIVRNILVLNRRLSENGHRRLHHTTIASMLHESCEMVFDLTPEEVAQIAAEEMVEGAPLA